MKKYPKYKNSGIAWLGEIPEHWDVRNVRNSFLFKTGFTPPTEKDYYFDTDGVTWITISDLKNKFVLKSKNGISKRYIAEYNKPIIKKGSLLYSFKLSVGKVAFAGKDLYTNEAIFSILPSSKYDLGYYYYSLPNQIIKNANENIYGAKILNQKLIKEAQIVFPPLPEQTAIANFLDYKLEKIERFITKKKQLIELLNEQKAAIINQAVTKGLDKNAKMKIIVNNWLNELPYNFEIESFSKNVFLKHGFQFREEHFSNEGIRIVKISQLSPKGILELSKASFVPLSYKEKFENIVIKEGDILMALTGGTIGKIIKANPKNEILLQNYRVGNFYPKNSKINKNYLYWILKSDFVQEQMSFYVRETGQPNIGKGDFNKIQLIIPPTQEQKQIVTHIQTETTKIAKTITTIEKEIALVEEYKTALIAEAVTGKIDVREFEVPQIEKPLAMVAEEATSYNKE